MGDDNARGGGDEPPHTSDWFARRSVLRGAGSVAAWGLGLGAVTSPATAGMTVELDVQSEINLETGGVVDAVVKGVVPMNLPVGNRVVLGPRFGPSRLFECDEPLDVGPLPRERQEIGEDLCGLVLASRRDDGSTPVHGTGHPQDNEGILLHFRTEDAGFVAEDVENGTVDVTLLYALRTGDGNVEAFVGTDTVEATDQAGGDAGETTDDAGDDTVVPIEEVPVELHRRAARHVEEVSGTETAPAWQAARLSGTVSTFYRPDVDGVAYYEFEVEPEGYVILATDTHDMPMPHWDFQGDPISSKLAKSAEEDGESVSRLYKMDALYYVGENDAGEIVAEDGTRLVKLSGHTEDHLDSEAESGRTYGPEQQVQSDQGAPNASYTLAEEFGPQESPIEFGAWESWTAMKESYEDAYGVLAEDLRRDAEEEWEIERGLYEQGRQLPADEPHYEVLLFEGAQFEVDGAGAQFVTVERFDRGALQPALRITVDTSPSERTSLAIDISYANGKQETRRFFVARDGDQQSLASYPDAVGDSRQFAVDSEPPTANVVSGDSDGGWDIWWAGDAGDQREYWQHEYEGCDVGCGPVAWGLLFGWADHQAWTGNSYWEPRWGLYRENADSAPADDADAPRDHSSGPRRMVEEINEYVDTFCAFGSGATTPWNMPEAWRYFRGRTGTWLRAWWSPIGFPRPNFRNVSRQSIIELDTPAIIGAGWLHHYPLAYGYAHRVTEGPIFGIIERHHHSFYVNNGWGDASSGWINGRTWFSGQIYPFEP